MPTLCGMRLLVAIGAVLAAVVFGALYAVPLELRYWIERRLSDSGYTVDVQDVQIAWLDGVVAVEGLRVVGTASDRAILEVPAAQVELRVLSLLPGGPVQVERVEARSPTLDLTVQESASGTWTPGGKSQDEGGEPCPVHVALIEAHDGTLRVPVRALGQPAVFSPTVLEVKDLRTGAAGGGRPTTARATATLRPGGTVEAELEANFATEEPDFHVVFDGTELPLSLLGKALGLQVTGGRADIHVQATVERGAYDGSIRLDADDLELEQTNGPLGEVKEEAAELGAEGLEAAGVLERRARFEGELEPDRNSFFPALPAILERAFTALLPL